MYVMPLTISHPAFILPFCRLGLHPTALIVGSIVPDFEFFIRMTDEKMISHTLAGIILFNLPVGLLLLLLFEYFLRKPLHSLLPEQFRSKQKMVNKIDRLTFVKLSLLIVSILTGIATHLLFDSFTHADGWWVQKVPFLFRYSFIVGQYSIPVYFILQYGISLIGFIIIAAQINKAAFVQISEGKLKRHFQRKTKHCIVGCFLLFGLVTGAVHGYSAIEYSSNVIMFKSFISQMAVTTVSAILFSVAIYASFWHLLEKKNLF
jgi:hypothetical protein